MAGNGEISCANWGMEAGRQSVGFSRFRKLFSSASVEELFLVATFVHRYSGVNGAGETAPHPDTTKPVVKGIQEIYHIHRQSFAIDYRRK